MTFLIKLYANNCGYCIDMIAEWEKLKILLGNTVEVIEIEHMELSESNNRLDIINNTKNNVSSHRFSKLKDCRNDQINPKKAHAISASTKRSA